MTLGSVKSAYTKLFRAIKPTELTVQQFGPKDQLQITDIVGPFISSTMRKRT
jgi:hypothetical protein